MRELERAAKSWQALLQGSEAEKADDYFDQEIMPLSCQRFVSKYQNGKLPHYYGLFVLLETAWQPLALAVAELRPENVHIIATKAGMPQMEKMMRFLPLAPDQYIATLVGSNDAAAVCRVIKKQYDIWESAGHCAMDVTGGRKGMYAAAAMMAAVLDVDAFYVDGSPLPGSEHFLPGSEHLEKLPNPRTLLNF